jgi:hypothetical protein
MNRASTHTAGRSAAGVLADESRKLYCTWGEDTAHRAEKSLDRRFGDLSNSMR